MIWSNSYHFRIPGSIICRQLFHSFTDVMKGASPFEKVLMIGWQVDFLTRWYTIISLVDFIWKRRRAYLIDWKELEETCCDKSLGQHPPVHVTAMLVCFPQFKYLPLKYLLHLMKSINTQGILFLAPKTSNNMQSPSPPITSNYMQGSILLIFFLLPPGEPKPCLPHCQPGQAEFCSLQDSRWILWWTFYTDYIFWVNYQCKCLSVLFGIWDQPKEVKFNV